MGTIMSSAMEEPFRIIGDFYCICFQHEGGNCSYRAKDSEDLNNIIQGENLWDVPPIDYEFTWFGLRSKKSILNEVLLGSSWPLSNNWKLYGDCRRSSDHIHLFLIFDKVN